MHRLPQIALATIMALAVLCTARADVYLNSAAVGSGPYYLDAAGETYILTEDIATTGSGLVFAAQNVTLDLNGHTVTFGTGSSTYRYGVVMPPPYPHSNPRWSDSDITVWNASHGATVQNGFVVQGGSGARCYAVKGYENHDLTLHDVSVLIFGDDTYAILYDECYNIHVYNNTVTDSTTVVTNRHEGRASIDILATWDGTIEIHDNTLHNCRQWGIRVKRRTPAETWGHVYSNQVYANTIVTNGYGVGLQGNRLEAHDNIINATNGRGIHVELCGQIKVYDNQVEVIEQPLWDEYNRLSAHGIKLESCSDVEVYGNYVISKGLANSLETVSNGSPLVLGDAAGGNNWIHHNTFIARHLGGDMFDPNDYGMYATAVEIAGMEEGSGCVVEENEFITHDRFFSATLWHGPNHPDVPVDAGDVVFRANHWSREATSAPTRKWDVFFSGCSVENLRFVDNDGGDFQNFGVGWPWLPCSWTVAYTGEVWTLDEEYTPIPDIDIEVRDGNGSLAATATTDDAGEASLTLDEFSVYTEGSGPDVIVTDEYNPYDFTAEFPEGFSLEQRTIDVPDWEVFFFSEPPTTPPAPMAGFEGTPLSGAAPLDVDFVDQSTNDPTSWWWDFGDGSTSTQQNPAHEYAEEGTFTVSLTVTNAGGEDTVTEVEYITVSAPPDPPEANFAATPLNGAKPLVVQFAEKCKGEDCTWLWVFGDGLTSTTRVPQHTYEQQGVYTVSLTITNEDGSDTMTIEDYITVTEGDDTPIRNCVDFTGSPTSGYAPLHVSFTDLTPSEDPTYWIWDFGDGTTSSSQNPEHVYTEPGVYTVELTTGNALESDLVTKVYFITVSEAPLDLSPRQSNPFLPGTAISYSIPDEGEVRLSVFGIDGRRVAVLDEGHRLPGPQEVTWDARGVPAGVYFVRLDWKTRVESKKVILVQ